MGSQTVVYGFIEGRQNYLDHINPERSALYADWNKSVILALPSTDEPPYLVKEMFAISEYNQVSLQYGFQIIHFGASYKNLEDEWPLWLAKFEQLLRQLHWGQAVVRIESDSVGSHEYRWRAQAADRNSSATGLRTPVTEWEFKGGSRSFDE